jgi:Protein of unknown function, DUF481
MRRGGSALTERLLGLGLAFVAAAPVATAADKTDVVEMSNGDKLTCEIKELDQGQLSVKTDGMGTVYLQWDKVVRISSGRRFEVELVSGERLYGSLLPPQAAGQVLVAAKTGPVELELSKIAFVFPLRSSFWSRFDGSLDVGGSYTQANKLLQLTPAFSATYGARAFQAGLDVNATWTRQEDEPSSSRAVATLRYARFRTKRWVTFGVGTAERNTELGLDVRLLLAGGAGASFFSGATAVSWWAPG